VIPIQKTAGKNKELKIRQADGFLHQIGKMGDNHLIGPGDPADICGFPLAICSVPGHNQYTHLGHKQPRKKTVGNSGMLDNNMGPF
jgi:hypothetical protein